MSKRETRTAAAASVNGETAGNRAGSAEDAPERMDPRRIETLLAVMARLRDPEKGCPWDVEQTFETIVPYTIEEAYEVADAIARGDMAELRRELGDLLLQVVFHARMAEEKGHFAFPDVVEAIVEKLVFRHPHVFGSPEERGRVQADFWERAKEAERAQVAARVAGDAAGDDGHGTVPSPAPSALDGIARALPALMRAEKLQKRAARAGYDWPDARGVLSKLDEERAELEAAMQAGNREAMTHEIGDLLFTLVNLARHLDVDPETALRQANDRFEQRFRTAERMAAAEGRRLREMTAKELDELWQRVKSRM